MEFPSLPTDSLYKFQTIAGLVLILGAAVLPRQYADSYRQKAREYGLAAEKLKIEAKHLGGDIDRETRLVHGLEGSTSELNASIPTLKAGRKRDRYVAEVRVKGIDQQIEELQTSKDKIITEGHEVELKLAELNGVDRESKDLLGDAKEATSEGKTMLFVGLILAITGLIGWNFNVQRYQDEILKHQALALRVTAPPNQRRRRRDSAGRLPES